MLSDEQIELYAMNDEPEDWNDLGHRKTWREGYVTGYKAAESAKQNISQLERKSNQDDETIIWQAEQISKHLDQIKELEKELAENQRLNGMGAEREATLLGKVERLERELAKVKHEKFHSNVVWPKHKLGTSLHEIILDGVARDFTNEQIISETCNLCDASMIQVYRDWFYSQMEASQKIENVRGFVEDYFAEDWAIEKGLLMLADYDKAPKT